MQSANQANKADGVAQAGGVYDGSIGVTVWFVDVHVAFTTTGMTPARLRNISTKPSKRHEEI